jgi:hypothetical protein
MPKETLDMVEMLQWFKLGFGITLGVIAAVLMVLVVAGVASDVSRAIKLAWWRRSRGTGQ